MADPGCKGQKKLKLSCSGCSGCSGCLKQLIIFCCTTRCISTAARISRSPLNLCHNYDFWRRKPSEAVIDGDLPLCVIRKGQFQTKVCSDDVVFQFCWLCADPEASLVSLASPNKVRGEAIYYFGGEPSWRNLGGSRWWPTIQTFPTVLHTLAY